MLLKQSQTFISRRKSLATTILLKSFKTLSVMSWCQCAVSTAMFFSFFLFSFRFLRTILYFIYTSMLFSSPFFTDDSRILICENKNMFKFACVFSVLLTILILFVSCFFVVFCFSSQNIEQIGKEWELQTKQKTKKNKKNWNCLLSTRCETPLIHFYSFQCFNFFFFASLSFFKSSPACLYS